jgi:hypothetical protein
MIDKTNWINKKKYKELHSSKLIPLNIKINCNLFEEEIKLYDWAFRQWGEKHTDFPRFGLPLINENGKLDNDPEPTCWPLDQWAEYKNLIYYKDVSDLSFRTPTEILNINSLQPLNPIKKYMIRSCILKWHTLGHFKPHIDTSIPSPIIRLWGTNDPKNFRFRFKDKDENFVIEKNIERGRIYLADTSITHDAFAIDDNVYQFFIALHYTSYDDIKNLLI